MLRYGKPIAENLEQEVKNFVQQQNLQGNYVSVIMLWADHPGAAYVSNKQKFAQRVWLEVKIFGNENKKWTEVDIIQMINDCKNDDACVGIIVQLPLPDYLQEQQQKIINCISGFKDIDGLTTPMIEFAEKHAELFTPATPRAVISIFDHYEYDLSWKKIAMLGYSNLIGRPLTAVMKQRWADVRVFTIESDQEEMKKFCHDEADIIVSATGHIHLVDESFVSADKSQVIIDVGRGYKDGKAVGDVQWELLQDNVAAITPVPGGVGPVTVAALFANIITLRQNAEKIAALLE